MKNDDEKPEQPEAPKPPSDALRKPLVLPPNVRDVTSQRAGKAFAIIGLPPRRAKP